ncbi:helix-turn-helix domain-containing protein [Streptacidiphilus rugosus]|uniref:helix-turn-helix domain-containing protein n=1 Tax=Streptacidiphilus rugosus TaxID=405783 RepID=UPI000562E1EE|nr:helix-turn-helix transcriptional regulator [Streptacidiphilus rugosus]
MATSPLSTAQAARESIARRLRELRLDAGLTADGLSKRCGWHPAKTSRIEHAKAVPTDADIRAWCDTCEQSAQAADLIRATRTADDLYVQWTRKHRSGLRQTQEELLPLHERTRVQRVYGSKVVSGFLQTPSYATALLDAITRFQGTPNDVPAAVEARMKRQRALFEGDHRFVVLLEESVLRYRVGGCGVMAGQLGHLLDVMGLPSLALGVIPFSADRHDMWPLEPFYAYDEEAVIVETLTAEIRITEAAEIATYLRAFRALGQLAVYGPRARALVEAAVDVLG